MSRAPEKCMLLNRKRIIEGRMIEPTPEPLAMRPMANAFLFRKYGPLTNRDVIIIVSVPKPVNT